MGREARSCPSRNSCKIFLAKHPNGLHEHKIRRKDDSKGNDDPGKTVKNNCTNIKDVQCELVRTGEVLSMCVLPAKVGHKNSDKEIMTFAMLDTCSQGTFIITSLMKQLNISGIQTFINIKTLTGHRKESWDIDNSVKWEPKVDKIVISVLKERYPSGLL